MCKKPAGVTGAELQGASKLSSIIHAQRATTTCFSAASNVAGVSLVASAA